MDPNSKVQEETLVNTKPINKLVEWTEDEWDNFNSEYSIG